MMKKIFFLALLAMITLQANAQLSYSVKAGWNWPEIKNGRLEEYSNFTMGVAVDYPLNKYLGIQSGINYKRITECDEAEVIPGGPPTLIVPQRIHAAFAEIPLLFTASVIPNPQRWRAIWNLGMFVSIPVEQYSPMLYYNYNTYYGVMAALQLEIHSHYFVRGEYQWALSSDYKRRWNKDRHTNMLSVYLGYRF